MKTTRYKFEKYLESAAMSESKEWLEKEFINILESSKEFTTKCDYIALSILGLDSKIDAIDTEISELKQLKQNLKCAKDISCTVGAKILQSYGIDKLEGLRVSSITITPATTNLKTNLFIYNKQALINEGYYKVELDEDAIKQAFASSIGDNQEKTIIAKYCDIKVVTQHIDAKLRVNKRRGVDTNSITFIPDDMLPENTANNKSVANIVVA